MDNDTSLVGPELAPLFSAELPPPPSLKETQELGILVKNILLGLGKAFENDGQIDLPTEVPPIVLKALADAPAAFGNVSKLKEEFTAHPALAGDAILHELLVGIDGLLMGLRVREQMRR